MRRIDRRLTWALVTILCWLPLIEGVSADTATQAAPALPSSLGGTASVWTGQYVYTFGGWDGNGYSEYDYSDQIVKHDPATGQVKVSQARLPGTRYLAAAIWDGTHAYIFGGSNLSTDYTQILRYDPVADSVTIMNARLPVPVYGLSAVFSGRYAYLLGGLSCESLPCKYVFDILRFDPQSDVLIDTGANIPARGFTSAAWDGQNAYIFGGSNPTSSSDVLRYSPSSNSVTKVASLPTRRYDTSAAFDGSHIYVFGGAFSSGSLTGEIVRFDPSDKSVSVVPATIPPRRQTSAVWTGTKFVIVGGYSADIAEYRPSIQWAGVPGTLPVGRSSSSAVWDGNNAYIFGGLNGSSRSDLIQRYDPSTGAVTSSASLLPGARSHTAAVWAGSSAFIFGGATPTVTDQIVRYSPSSDTVEKMPARLPAPTASASAIWDGSHVYLFGGTSGNSYSEKIYRYDPIKDEVATMGAVLPSGRTGTVAVWDGSFAYIFGGSASGQLFDQVLRYDPATDTITVMPDVLPRPSARFSAIAGPDGLYIFGGTYWVQECYQGECYNVTTYSKEIFRYRPSLNEMVVAEAKLPTLRADSAAVRVGNEALILGGWDGASYTTKILRYRPVPGAPSDFKVDPGPGGGEISLSWQAPSSASHASPITGYRVYVRNGGSGTETLLAELGPEARSFVQSGLSNGAQRYYTVTAVNAIGEGVATAEIGTRAPIPPSPPPTLSGGTGPQSGSVQLNWSKPLNNGGSALTGYRVYRGSDSSDLVAVADVTSTTYVDPGLQHSIYYWYKVAAMNAAGVGGGSVTINVRSSGPPGTPTDLQAVPWFTGTSLTWSPPSWSGGSVITEYKIYRRVGSQAPTYLATAPGPHYVDTRCRVGNLCHYTVSAVSAFGESRHSDEAFTLGTSP